MKNLFLMGLGMLTLGVLITSCKKDDEALQQNDLRLNTSPALGQYLTNKAGQTLYIFANDADGTNNCAGVCESIWPVFNADINTAVLDNGLFKSDFGSITNAGGKKQLTYKGWPLYTYSPAPAGTTAYTAEDAGKTTGEAVGGVWFVAKPDYTIMLANKQLTGADGNNYKSDYTVGTGRTLYFTNSAGITIYGFTNDSFNINKFTRPDFANNAVWPIYEQDKVVVPSTLNKNLFSTINVFGKKQLVYKGWPLYNFGQDGSVRGSNKGVSVPVPGRWPIMVKDIIEARR